MGFLAVGLGPVVAQVLGEDARSGTLEPSAASQPMKIITKTPTHLLLQADLRRDYLISALFMTVWTGGWVFLFFVPGRMQLNCQRHTPEPVCQVTFWNMLNLHSSTKSIQLKGSSVKTHVKSGPDLILNAGQEEIRFLDGMDVYLTQQQIRQFLENPAQSSLNVQIDQPWTSSAFKTVMLIIGTITLPKFLKEPTEIQWEFILEPDPDCNDKRQSVGQIHETLQGVGWEAYVQHQFTDIVALDIIRFSKGRYYMSFRLRSGEKLALRSLSRSPAEWKMATNAISELLQISPPELPWKN